MSKNGSKLETIGAILALVESIALVVSALFFITQEQVLLGVGILLVGGFCVYVSITLFYAFAELLDTTASINAYLESDFKERHPDLENIKIESKSE